MDARVETFYRQIYDDLVVSPEESESLVKFFSESNPPPDKLVWLRSTAFRLGCEYLTDDQDNNVKLLRAINAIVHSLEKTCMTPKLPYGNCEYDGDKVEEFYKGIFGDLSVDFEENEALVEFFKENVPPQSNLIALRATAFKAAVDHLSDDKESNVALLRCVNVVVHNLELNVFKPKVYQLKQTPQYQFDLDVNLSDAIQQMWDLDLNRLTPNKDYTLNVQDGKKPYWKEDAAEDPLFTYVDKAALKRPTYKAFYALLDNYKAECGQAERVTSSERQENREFLKTIMQTAPMQLCHKYLVKKGEAPESQDDFMKLLHKIWFDLYGRSRGGPKDSSGFEHVFIGEVKDGKVSGFHNWIQFYMEEQKGSLDYRGYIKPRGRGEARADSDDHVLTLQFAWNGVEKFVGTSFIGVSPEFEMALYTTCFLLGEEENDIILNTKTDEFHLKVKCYRMGRDHIGTSFPEATAHYD